MAIVFIVLVKMAVASDSTREDEFSEEYTHKAGTEEHPLLSAPSAFAAESLARQTSYRLPNKPAATHFLHSIAFKWLVSQ